MDITAIINQRITSALRAIRRPFRAALARITTTGGVMTAQLDGLAGETLQEVEVFQQYGLTSVPPAGAMAVVVPLGGVSSHSIVIATEHSQYRLQALEPGEVALYDAEGTSVVLKKGKIIQTTCDVFDLTCKTMKVKATESAEFDTPTLTATQHLIAQGAITGNGGMTISNASGGSGAVATFAGDIAHTSGEMTSTSITINGVKIGTHIHTTPDGDSGQPKN